METHKSKKNLEKDSENGIDNLFDLKKIFASKMRIKIILILDYSKKNLEEISRDLNKDSASISHRLKELETMKIVIKENKYYYLSSIGCLLLPNIKKLIDNCYLAELYSNFWENHIIESIPPNFLTRINNLKNMDYISANETNVSETLIKYTESIESSKNLNILLTVFSSGHLDSILKNLDKEDTTLNLIATKTVLKSIKNNNYDEYLLKINKTKNIRIWELSEEVKLFLTVCDNFLSFNLFFKDGYYDDSVSIMDNSAEGLLWGIELFDYYKEKGKLIDIEEYFS